MEHRHGGAWRVRRHVLVAVDARDLLDEILLDGEIESPRGRRGAEISALLRDFASEASQDPAHFRVLDAVAKQRAQAWRPHAHRRPRGQVAASLGDGTRASAANLEHQRARALERIARGGEIDAALETMRSVARERKLASLTLNGLGMAEGRLEEHLRAPPPHHGPLSAHHAAEPHRPAAALDPA